MQQKMCSTNQFMENTSNWILLLSTDLKKWVITLFYFNNKKETSKTRVGMYWTISLLIFNDAELLGKWRTAAIYDQLEQNAESVKGTAILTDRYA